MNGFDFDEYGLARAHLDSYSRWEMVLGWAFDWSSATGDDEDDEIQYFVEWNSQWTGHI